MAICDKGWSDPRKRLYRTWMNMRQRCRDPRVPAFKYYGGRGVRVCPQWDSYAQFEKDMGPHPGPGWTLDRENTDGHYDPDNCRWATRKTQRRNRRDAKIDDAIAGDIRQLYSAGMLNQYDIADMYGVSQATTNRIIRGKCWL